MTKTSVQFADSYEGCQVVANIMGLNVETVRKRAKAGKIPGRQNARGVWVFSHHDLFAAGIEPFKSHGCAHGGHTVALPKVNVTDVIFVLDRSSSMSGLASKLRESLDDQLATLRSASNAQNRYSFSVINFNGTVDVTLRNAGVLSVPEAGRLYLNPNGMTALYDAIGEAISLSRQHDDGTHALLISVITDGEENNSKRVSEATLAESIRSLTGTDRYTFTYAGPPGSEYVASRLGFLPGNVTTWATTLEGITTLGTTSRASLNSYTQARGQGVMRATSFYAQPVTGDAVKFANQLDSKLDDVTAAVRVERVVKGDPLKIKDFSKRKFGDFQKGSLFYELTSAEKVQDYKRIVVQDTTKGQFFSGWNSAKSLLGLPDFHGTVRIKPGNLGEFKVFVQSTSQNRLLEPGTAVVRLTP